VVLKSIPFMVYDRPHCVVGPDLVDRNLEFLRGVRPEYFQFLCQQNLTMLCQHSEPSDQIQKAYLATNIRLLYGQALEAFFGMLFALLQAPMCLPAWLQSYWPEQLRKMVSIIDNAEAFDYFKIRLEKNDWDSLARKITILPDELPHHDDIVKGYGRLWATLAADFLNEKRSKEYNSLKHGFRVIQGGFRLSIGKESSPGMPTTPASMISLGGSPYGCTTFFANRIDNQSKDTTVFALRRTSFNWDPHFLSARIELIRYSIQNIASLAIGLSQNDLTNELFYYPDDINTFDTALFPKVGITDFDVDYSYSSIGQLALTSQNVHDYYKSKFYVEEKTHGDLI
jgi:hypothetical protein